MPLAQIAEPWPTMELVQLETEVMRARVLSEWYLCSTGQVTGGQSGAETGARDLSGASGKGMEGGANGVGGLQKCKAERRERERERRRGSSRPLQQSSPSSQSVTCGHRHRCTVMAVTAGAARGHKERVREQTGQGKGQREGGQMERLLGKMQSVTEDTPGKSDQHSERGRERQTEGGQQR
ncbi:hypothetical protein INR49_019883 [Caranx melampygus]|nr:hypothetical protein INR49_019883 [Caranx melampygus]